MRYLLLAVTLLFATALSAQLPCCSTPDDTWVPYFILGPKQEPCKCEYVYTTRMVNGVDTLYVAFRDPVDVETYVQYNTHRHLFAKSAKAAWQQKVGYMFRRVNGKVIWQWTNPTFPYNMDSTAMEPTDPIHTHN